MLLRAGADVNATDFVSGFIQMQMWLVCMQPYEKQTSESSSNIVLLSE